MGEIFNALLGFVGAADVDAGIGVGDRTVLGVGSLGHFSVRFCRLGRFRAPRAEGIVSAHQILTRFAWTLTPPPTAGKTKPPTEPGAIAGRDWTYFLSSFFISSFISSFFSFFSFLWCFFAFFSILSSFLSIFLSSILSWPKANDDRDTERATANISVSSFFMENAPCKTISCVNAQIPGTGFLGLFPGRRIVDYTGTFFQPPKVPKSCGRDRTIAGRSPAW